MKTAAIRKSEKSAASIDMGKFPKNNAEREKPDQGIQGSDSKCTCSCFFVFPHLL